MDRLKRRLAPISDEGWELIDEEATRSLRHFLAARRLVDFSGPHGWERSSIPLGLAEPAPAGEGADGVETKVRTVQPLVELRTSFTLDRSDLDRIDRGWQSPDLDPVTEAAHRIAIAEDRTIFDGGAGALGGIAAASPHEPVEITDDYDAYPKPVARAVARLRRAGIEGPYGIALGDRCYTGVVETSEHGGYPVIEHLHRILGGPVIWAPAVDGAIVVSVRGGDYELVSGADFAIGYASHDASTVELYLEESFAFLIHERAAGIALRYS